MTTEKLIRDPQQRRALRGLLFAGGSIVAVDVAATAAFHLPGQFFALAAVGAVAATGALVALVLKQPPEQKPVARKAPATAGPAVGATDLREWFNYDPSDPVKEDIHGIVPGSLMWYALGRDEEDHKRIDDLFEPHS